jgi:hypothetical protein
MKCLRCQQDNPVADAQFCSRCGAPAEQAAQGAASTVPYSDLQRELTDALEQQAATSEILRVISSSPTDVQPVFDAIVARGARLCDADFCIVFRFDGTIITLAAHDGRSPGTLDVIRAAYPAPPGRRSGRHGGEDR